MTTVLVYEPLVQDTFRGAFGFWRQNVQREYLGST